MPGPTLGAKPYMASENGNLEVVRELLDQGATSNLATTETGTTPLHKAPQHGHLEVVRLLLDRAANPNQARTTDGSTALMMVAYECHRE